MGEVKKVCKGLFDFEAKQLGLKLNKKKPGRNQAWYYITPDQWREVYHKRGLKTMRGKKVDELVSVKSESVTSANDYKDPAAFNITAWNPKGYMMDIDEYCKTYKLPREDVSSYKLITHTGTPFYNIVYKERSVAEIFDDGFIEEVVKKYAVSLRDPGVKASRLLEYDFDVVTFTDVHIGMDTDKWKNTMYKNPWNKKVLMEQARQLVEYVLENQKGKKLIIDDLGDLLDGQDGKTVRQGHDLPQNMSNEEMFDAAFEFKIYVLDHLFGCYESILVNNICNDNHSGVFAYYSGKMLKEVAAIRYSNVEVENHRQFINHYETEKIVFLISHGKDDKTLKYGFKVHLDAAGVEKIDQYCKRHNLYSKGKLIVFKKGDSHQALFDFCTSDDFYYFNYPAFSPSSNWIKNNFKLGRRGFVFESYKGRDLDFKPYFFDDVA